MFQFFRSKEDVKDIRRRLYTIDHNIQQSFSNLKDDMKEIGKWIHHFDREKNEQKEFIHALESKIDTLELQLIEREAAMKRSKIEHVQPSNRSVQPFMNVQPYVQPFEQMFNQQNLPNLNEFGRLTPAQKRVIGLLLYSGGPMDYEEIARRLEINPITARRHINDVKRVGVGIRKKVSDNGRKNLYFLDERVKASILKEINPAQKEEKED